MATDCLKELLGGSNCTGACTYTWVENQYVLTSNTCSGGPNCTSCPKPDALNSLILRGLVYALGPTCFPNPDDVTGSCAVDLENLTGQLAPALKRLELYKLLVKLSIGLGIVTLLSLGGMIYALFFR